VTLKNAQSRFTELGWECERTAAGTRRYRARRLGTPDWCYSSDLDVLLTAARAAAFLPVASHTAAQGGV